MKTTINLFGTDTTLDLKKSTYCNNQSLALISDDGENGYEPISINLKVCPSAQNNIWGNPDCSEIIKELIKQDILIPTGKQVRQNFGTYDEYQINDTIIDKLEDFN